MVCVEERILCQLYKDKNFTPLPGVLYGGDMVRERILKRK
jgi:hypothetical protein